MTLVLVIFILTTQIQTKNKPAGILKFGRIPKLFSSKNFIFKK